MPDLTGKKLLLATEEPRLNKALAGYKLVDREIKLRTLKERISELGVSTKSLYEYNNFNTEQVLKFSIFFCSLKCAKKHLSVR